MQRPQHSEEKFKLFTYNFYLNIEKMTKNEFFILGRFVEHVIFFSSLN